MPSAPLPAVSPIDAWRLAPGSWRQAPGSGLRATWLGHLTVLIDLHDRQRLVRRLTDPV